MNPKIYPLHRENSLTIGKIKMKNYYALSDLHMGYGPLQDFENGQDLINFLDQREKDDVVVFNGDTFDFLQSPCSEIDSIPQLSVPGYPMYGATEEESCQKLRLIIKQHANIFKAFRACYQKGVAIHFIAGNHDVDILWPAVRSELIEAISAGTTLQAEITVSREVALYSGKNEYPDVRIFHGHQQSGPANLFKRWDDLDCPCIKDKTGIQHLEQPWGSRLLTCLVNEIDKDFSYIDNIKPLSKFLRVCWRTNERPLAVLCRIILKHIIDIAGDSDQVNLSKKDLQLIDKLGDIASIDQSCQEWINSILQDAQPPQKQLTAGLITDRNIMEIAETKETRKLKEYAKNLVNSKQCKVVICGHTHESIFEKLGCNAYLNTGCWIPYLKPRERYFYHWEKKVIHSGNLEFYRSKNSEYFTTSLSYATFSHDSENGLCGIAELNVWNNGGRNGTVD